ncbi:hypothetical protein EMPG_12443, partial [Blastomyces silverae]
SGRLRQPLHPEGKTTPTTHQCDKNREKRERGSGRETQPARQGLELEENRTRTNRKTLYASNPPARILWTVDSDIWVV